MIVVKTLTAGEFHICAGIAFYYGYVDIWSVKYPASIDGLLAIDHFGTISIFIRTRNDHDYRHSRIKRWACDSILEIFARVDKQYCEVSDFETILKMESM